MKKFIYSIICLSWICLMLSMKHFGFLTFDTNHIRDVVRSFAEWAPWIFFLFFSLRLCLLLPSSIFVIAGGMMFPLWQNILISISSMVISQSGIYLFGRFFSTTEMLNGLQEKHPKLYKSIETNTSRFLLLMSCSPATPIDLACFLSAAMKMRYTKFLSLMISGFTPLVIFYSLFGRTILDYPWLSVIITVCLFASYYIYKKVFGKSTKKENG
ncbi:TVP38/TMEM64 family protein [Bacillus sp. EAC]|uniref:TVP38/TMEM64 family protein n=1 Tax=Bacillus sp. EAC TaxID=1978338 RepID=UPI000B4445BD|nr:VTT domain-containing protein [Bacillus sp. EAC]